MGTTNAQGVYIYDATDQISPIHTLLNLQSSALTTALSPLQKGYVHIASNSADRNAQATAYGPSATNPFLCWRADAVAGLKYEYTYNGSTWFTLSTSEAADADTGWVAMPLTDTTNFDLYTAGDTMRARRVGSTVWLRGTLRLLTAGYVSSGTGRTFASIPSGIPTPTYGVNAVMQSSNSDRWAFNVSSAGNLLASRYGPAAPAVNAWLPFYLSYPVG